MFCFFFFCLFMVVTFLNESMFSYQYFKNFSQVVLTPSLRPVFQICPICAALPGGDPNHVTDDFTAHLTLEHRAPRDLISFLLCRTPLCVFVCVCCSLTLPFHCVVSTLTASESRRVEQRSTCTQDVPPGPRTGRLQSTADQYALY